MGAFDRARASARRLVIRLDFFRSCRMIEMKGDLDVSTSGKWRRVHSMV